jgi:hypothetical protein
LYANAFGQAPEFYKFQRTLEAYRKVLDGTTSLFLPADAEVFRLLRFDLAPAGDGTGGEPPPTPKSDELAARAGEDPAAAKSSPGRAAAGRETSGAPKP